MLFSQPTEDAFTFDCLNEIFGSSKDSTDEQEIILSAKLGSILYQSALKDQKKMNAFMENIFLLLTTNDNLELLSAFLYFVFLENEDENLEELKMIISNLFVKSLRRDSFLDKRFLSLTIYNFLGNSKIINEIFKQSLIFWQSSLLEKPTKDYFMGAVLQRKFEDVLQKRDS